MINVGIANLQVECKNDFSTVVDQFSQAPLQLHRPLYLDNESFPTVYLKTPSSGLLGGDEHHVAVSVGKNSQLKLRTQASTLLYPGVSSVTIDIKIAAGGKLTFLPHPIILGAGGHLKQYVRIDLAEDSALEYSDSWCAGRIAMQELWRFKCFEYCLEIFREEKLLYREKWSVDPQKPGTKHPLVCGDYTNFSSLYSFGEYASAGHISAALPECEWEKNQTWTLEKNGDVITKRCAMAYPV